jgi:hypothetical protein
MTVSPTNDQIATAMRSFLLAVLPSTGSGGNPVQVILAQPNRVPEPSSADFVVMTPLRMERLETNFDSFFDAVFTGYISGTTMHITAVDPRFNVPIVVGSVVSGVNITSGTTVTAVLSGAGGIGTYTVTPSQTVGSETISTGAKTLQIALKCTMQLDFHSANDTDAGDMANTVSTLFRDEYGTNLFANQSPNYGVVPLYADDPAQRPFYNGEQQIEWRWVIDALLQCNVVVSVPQQYTDSVTVTPINVLAQYGP